MADEFPADDALARLLGVALGADPMPPGLVDRAAELVALADLDAELAALDDEVPAEPAGVRGGPADLADLLVFTSADGATSVEVTVVDGGIDGQLLGADTAPGIVVQRADDRRSSAEVDEFGRFRVRGLEPGPVRLLVGRSPTLVVTDWFVI